MHRHGTSSSMKLEQDAEGSPKERGARHEAAHGEVGRRRKRDGRQELAQEANGTWHEARTRNGTIPRERVRQDAAARKHAGTADKEFAAR